MAPRTVQVYTSVAEAIKARIAAGGWVAGQRLPSISQLAQEYRVGTGSVREAVRVLASAGMIRVEHGRGMFVSEPLAPAPGDAYAQLRDIGAGSILALSEARRILEPELAALAAERGTDHDLWAIREQALTMERLVAAGEDHGVPDLQFHQQIALAAHNPVLARMMEGVNELLRVSRAITSAQASMTQRAVRYHLLIADAICDRNVVQARLLMLAHINDVISRIQEWQSGAHSSTPADRAAHEILLQQHAWMLHPFSKDDLATLALKGGD